MCRPPISTSGEDDGVESKEVLAGNGQEGLKGDVNWQRMWTVSPCNCFEARRELLQLGDCGDGEYLRRTLAEEFQQMEPRVQIQDGSEFASSNQTHEIGFTNYISFQIVFVRCYKQYSRVEVIYEWFKQCEVGKAFGIDLVVHPSWLLSCGFGSIKDKS